MSLNPLLEADSEDDSAFLEPLKEFSEVSDNNPFAENFLASVHPAETQPSESITVSDLTSTLSSSSSDPYKLVAFDTKRADVDSFKKEGSVEANVVIKHLREGRNSLFKADCEDDSAFLEPLKEFSEDDNPFAENFLASVHPAETQPSESITVSDLTSTLSSSSDPYKQVAFDTKRADVDSFKKAGSVEANVVIKHLREGRNSLFKAYSEDDSALLEPLKEFSEASDDKPFAKVDLPQDLIAVIISKLHIKEIFKCKCLSTYLKNRIESATFKTTPTKLLVLYAFNASKKPDVTYFKLFDNTQAIGTAYFPHAVRPINSAEGLLFLKGYSLFFKGYSQCSQLYLWNPLEREYLEIFSLPYEEEKGVSYGFGWTPDDGYKIVQIRQNHGETSIQYNVFLASSSTWNRGEPINNVGDIKFDGDGNFLDGKLYWMISKTNFPGCYVFVCHLSSLTFSELSCPQEAEGYYSSLCINAGKLCINSLDDQLSVISLWIMETDNVWKKICVVDIIEQLRRNSCILEVVNDDVLHSTDNAILSYSLKNHSEKVIFKFDRSGGGSWDGLVYAPTTVALKHLVGDAELKRIPMNYLNKKLINDPNSYDVVTEFIEGLVETYPCLQYLDGFPEVKVVLRANVSGGGSGHEPADAGFVGEGMLTAAICGDVFVSPPVDSILAGIRAVTGPPGCLLVVKNYPWDRLNFRSAAEQAKCEGYKVEVVIVADDYGVPLLLRNKSGKALRGISARRGSTGTILVHKIAGAAAASGLSLEVVAAEAKRASDMVGTIGVAFSLCTVPGQVNPYYISRGTMELGIGIHGEQGNLMLRKRKGQPDYSGVPDILKQILSPENVPIARGSSIVLVINGLGATPLRELMPVVKEAVLGLKLDHELTVERVYTGSFLTSLDMEGFSITVMSADQAVLKRLDAPTRAPYWPVAVDGNRKYEKIFVPHPPSRSNKDVETASRPKQLTPLGHTLEVAIEAAATAIINLEDVLKELDIDCESRMSKGASAILDDMKKCYPLNDPAETVCKIGSSIRKVMEGKSGNMYIPTCTMTELNRYAIFFMGAYAHLKANNDGGITFTAPQWAGALEAAITAVSNYSGAKAGSRTLLDALIPASSVLKKELASGKDPIEAFMLSANAAIAGAELTENMKPKEKQLEDVSAYPGATAAARWYQAAALAVKNKFKGSL